MDSENGAQVLMTPGQITYCLNHHQIHVFFSSFLPGILPLSPVPPWTFTTLLLNNRVELPHILSTQEDGRREEARGRSEVTINKGLQSLYTSPFMT